MLLIVVLVPLVPLSCLALVLWLDHLEETLVRDCRRRQCAPRWRAEAVRVRESPGVSDEPVAPLAGGSTKR
jgi:hypothetical protein